MYGLLPTINVTVGQTLCIRYKEQMWAIKNKSASSEYVNHIWEHKDTMKVIKIEKGENIWILWRNYIYIYNE
jgi:hypothetical protein